MERIQLKQKLNHDRFLRARSRAEPKAVMNTIIMPIHPIAWAVTKYRTIGVLRENPSGRMKAPGVIASNNATGQRPERFAESEYPTSVIYPIRHGVAKV